VPDLFRTVGKGQAAADAEVNAVIERLKTDLARSPPPRPPPRQQRRELHPAAAKL